jgi:hypothetical protein
MSMQLNPIAKFNPKSKHPCFSSISSLAKPTTPKIIQISMSKEITNIQAQRERQTETEREFSRRDSQLFHDSINDFVWSKEITNISAARARERERERERNRIFKKRFCWNHELQ